MEKKSWINGLFSRGKSLGDYQQLEGDLKRLEDRLEDDSFHKEVQTIETKILGGETGSSSTTGSFGIVEEQFDLGMLQKLACTEPWFYVAVNTIAKTIASIPLKLEAKKTIKQTVSQADGSETEVCKEVWIDASAEPEQQLFDRPNDIQVPMEFKMLLAIDLLATGNAYVYVHKNKTETLDGPFSRLQQAVDRTRKTNVSSLFRLNSAFVEPLVDDSGKFISTFQLQSDFGVFDFDPDEIIHIKLPNPCDPLLGHAPIVAVLKNLLLDRFSTEHRVRFFKNGARLGGVITTTKKLTKEQLTRLQRIFEGDFTGKKNHHKTLILPDGMDYKIIEQNTGDTSLVDFLKANKEPILAAFNLPPIKVGILDGASFANAFIQNKTYFVDTIMPILTLIEQAFNMHKAILKPERKLRVKFDLSNIEALQEDLQAKAQVASSMAQSGLSINEIRERLWKAGPVEGGEAVPLVQQNQPPALPLDFGAFKKVDQKTDVQNLQADNEILTDVTPTKVSFEERVTQLVAIAISNGIPIEQATPAAIAQALEEGFKPVRLITEKPTEEQQKETNENHTEDDKGLSKEIIAAYWKQVTTDGVQDFMQDKLKETNSFLDKLEKAVIAIVRRKLKKTYNWRKKHYKGNIEIIKGQFDKVEGIFDYRIKVDSDDILTQSEPELERLIKEEIERVSLAEKKAMELGYKFSIPSKSFTFPNKVATAVLKKIALRKIKSVTETTIKQMKNIIVSSVTDQVSPNEIASRIRDKFKEVNAGRALLIAKQETLTAVSLGQQLKRSDLRKKAPKDFEKLKKKWITAKDDKVRDDDRANHKKLEGEERDANEKFSNGLRFPRDPQAKNLAEVMGCRCTTIDFLPDDVGAIRDALNSPSGLAQESESFNDQNG